MIAVAVVCSLLIGLLVGIAVGMIIGAPAGAAHPACGYQPRSTGDGVRTPPPRKP